jgi:uncharacterized Zn finger protein
MDLPSALYTGCPSCGEETLHRVVKGKISEKKGFIIDAVVKCSQCGHTHASVIKAEKNLTIPVIVSELESSIKKEIELSENDTVSVGDEFLLDKGRIKIASIETKKGRVNSSQAKDVITLWAKTFDRLRLKISINKGSRTFTRTVWAVPDEEFFVGDVMRIKGDNIVIHRIKTQHKILKQGSAEARNIVRLYGKIAR